MFFFEQTIFKDEEICEKKKKFSYPREIFYVINHMRIFIYTLWNVSIFASSFVLYARNFFLEITQHDNNVYGECV